MTEIYKELKLSVYGDPGADSAYAKQLDADSGGVIITMMDGDQAVEVDSSCTAKLRVLKPDGKSCDGPATIENGKIKAKYTDQMLAVSGRCLADVTLTDGTGKRLSTMSFVLIVELVPYGSHIDSINEYTTFQEAMDAVTEAAESAAEDAADIREIYQYVIDSDAASLRAELMAGTEETAGLHLGFYKDADGNICQVDE